jgi:hypothetical protein
MTDIKSDKLQTTSTDMLVGMLANTDKLVSSNNRWNYADHRDDKDSSESDESVLDADTNDYIKNAKKSSQSTLFKKHDSEHDSKNDSKHHSKDETTTSDNKHSDTDNKNTETDTATEKDINTKKLSKKELMLLKLDMLRKLGELKQCGVHLSQNYNLESDLEMMQFEYQLHHDIRSKQNSVQWMSHMMIGIVKGTEMFNDSYNPFDMKLSGLSDKISSDMRNYYAVLGDIYEKYNQPGKQMAPEMRLLLMVSGAALSMQVNKVLPGIGGMANLVNNEDNLKELRHKAEADSNKKDYFKEQHDAATQRAADLKMIEEKDLEFQRMNKMQDEQQMQKFKKNLTLSSEAPSKDIKKKKDINTDQLEKLKQQKYIEQQQLLHQQQLQQMQQQQMQQKQQQQLDMMRQIAHQKSELFRNNNSNMSNDDKRLRDLSKQNNHLNKILEEVESSKKTKKDVKHSTKRSEKTSDNDSVTSSRSTISIHPDIKNVMFKTSEKAKKESLKKMSNASEDSDKKKSYDKKNSDYNKGEFKLDKNMQKFLEKDDNSENSKEEISIGSRSSHSGRKKSSKSNSNSTEDLDKKRTTTEMMDFAGISVGSRTKGSKPSLNFGTKR